MAADTSLRENGTNPVFNNALRGRDVGEGFFVRVDETEKNKQHASQTNRTAERRNDCVFSHAISGVLLFLQSGIDCCRGTSAHGQSSLPSLEAGLFQLDLVVTHSEF